LIVAQQHRSGLADRIVEIALGGRRNGGVFLFYCGTNPLYIFGGERGTFKLIIRFRLFGGADFIR
jgi:hypothetical protein